MEFSFLYTDPPAVLPSGPPPSKRHTAANTAEKLLVPASSRTVLLRILIFPFRLFYLSFFFFVFKYITSLQVMRHKASGRSSSSLQPTITISAFLSASRIKWNLTTSRQMRRVWQLKGVKSGGIWHFWHVDLHTVPAENRCGNKRRHLSIQCVQTSSLSPFQRDCSLYSILVTLEWSKYMCSGQTLEKHQVSILNILFFSTYSFH